MKTFTAPVRTGSNCWQNGTSTSLKISEISLAQNLKKKLIDILRYLGGNRIFIAKYAVVTICTEWQFNILWNNKSLKNQFLEYLLWRTEVTAIQTKHVKYIFIHRSNFSKSLFILLLFLRQGFLNSGPESDKWHCLTKTKVSYSCIFT